MSGVAEWKPSSRAKRRTADSRTAASIQRTPRLWLAGNARRVVDVQPPAALANRDDEINGRASTSPPHNWPHVRASHTSQTSRIASRVCAGRRNRVRACVHVVIEYVSLLVCSHSAHVGSLTSIRPAGCFPCRVVSTHETSMETGLWSRNRAPWRHRPHITVAFGCRVSSDRPKKKRTQQLAQARAEQHAAVG